MVMYGLLSLQDFDKLVDAYHVDVGKWCLFENIIVGESLTHLDKEFESFKKGILKVKDYLFTFLSNPLVPYDNNGFP